MGHRVLSREGWWLAAVLAGGPGAVLSHAPAAALWGIRQTAAATVDLIVPRTRHRRPGIRFHRAAIDADEVTTEQGVPVTTPARTLLDLAKSLDRHRLQRATDRAEQHRLTGPHSLDALLERYPKAPGAAKLKRSPSKAETNQRIDDMEVDCLWRDAKLVVELDGRATHHTTAAFERDRGRDRALQSQGWRVIRITWRPLHLHPAAVRRDLQTLLRS